MGKTKILVLGGGSVSKALIQALVLQCGGTVARKVPAADVPDITDIAPAAVPIAPAEYRGGKTKRGKQKWPIRKKL